MFSGRPVRLRRVGRLAALAAVAGLALPASASALTVEGAVADAVAGVSGAPAGTVLTMFVEADPGTPVPRSVAFSVGQGLQFGPTGPGCDPQTVRDAPLSCPAGSEVGAGEMETSAGSFDLAAFTTSGGGLAVRIETSPSPVLVDVATGSVAGGGSTLALALPGGIRGATLQSLRLRLGGMDPANDWVRSTLCPNGAWSLGAALTGDGGQDLGSGVASIGCRPPRLAQLSGVSPSFSLSRRIRNGKVSPLQLTGVSLPAGLPADGTAHVTCRAGCRGSWSRGVRAGGPTQIPIRPSLTATRRNLQLQIAVASPSIRGTYLVIRFTRSGGRVTGWKGVGRGCLRLGSAPVRISCPR